MYYSQIQEFFMVLQDADLDYESRGDKGTHNGYENMLGNISVMLKW